jgi:hypothetical protein
MSTRRVPDLETLFTDRRYWGVETAEPVQRAFCRIVEGRPLGELASNPDVEWAVGGPEALAILATGGPAPRQVSIYGAVRIGKSDLASCIAFRASQVVDLSNVRAHEIPRIPILSLTKDLADVTIGHLVGRLHKPALRPLLVDEGPDWVRVLHPSGAVIEIAVAAGARAAGSLVARWVGGVVFDEKPRMLGAGDDVVINYDDARTAVDGRLLAGAQVIDLGSPWAPWGPAWDDVQQRWGKPTRHHVVLRCTGPMANPAWWTPERCSDLRESKPRAYATECMGNFADGAANRFLEGCNLDALTDDSSELYVVAQGVMCIDAAGAATAAPRVGNDYAFMLVRYGEGQVGGLPYLTTKQRNAAGEEYEGPVFLNGDPRSPAPNPAFRRARILYVSDVGSFTSADMRGMSAAQVVESTARLALRNGITQVVSDQWSAWALGALYSQWGLQFHCLSWSGPSKLQAAKTLKRLILEGALRLQPGPEAETLKRELGMLEERVTTQSTTISAPTRHGHHCDRASALLTAMHAEDLGMLPGSPTMHDRARREYYAADLEEYRNRDLILE